MRTGRTEVEGEQSMNRVESQIENMMKACVCQVAHFLWHSYIMVINGASKSGHKEPFACFCWKHCCQQEERERETKQKQPKDN